jgi:hypothetical protein
MPRKITFACLATVFLPSRSSRYWHIFLILVLTLFGCVLGSGPARGQATTSVRGTVTDPDANAIVGASVVLANAESKTERKVTTGDQGEYQFLLVPPGTYTLSVTAPGFRGYEQKELALLVNTPATANVQLKIGATTEVVTVTSEAPALDMVDASIGNSFDERQVRQIPLEGRNVPDLLSLQAGVTYVTLDGVDVNDQSNGYAFTSVLPVTQDSVQEFRVTTTNYGADQGQGSGAQVALVTKSGTNAFHGSAYEYLRNTITSANDYLVKQSELNIDAPNKPLQLNRKIFGATVGGPTTTVGQGTQFAERRELTTTRPRQPYPTWRGNSHWPTTMGRPRTFTKPPSRPRRFPASPPLCLAQPLNTGWICCRRFAPAPPNIRISLPHSFPLRITLRMACFRACSTSITTPRSRLSGTRSLGWRTSIFMAAWAITANQASPISSTARQACWAMVPVSS